MIKEQVYNALQKGRQNAIDKYELANKLGITERNVRGHVESLREAGYPIISSSHFKGMYIATDDEEGIADIQQLRAETISRIRKLKNTVSMCDDFLEMQVIKNQMRLESDIIWM